MRRVYVLGCVSVPAAVLKRGRTDDAEYKHAHVHELPLPPPPPSKFEVGFELVMLEFGLVTCGALKLLGTCKGGREGGR